MASDKEEIVKRGLRAYEERGVDGLLEFVHPEFEMTTPAEIASEPDTYGGHEGLRRYFESFFEIMDEVRMEPTEIIVRGDDVLVRFDLVARGRSSGIEAIQKAYAIWEVDDDLLRGIRFFISDDELTAAWESGGEHAG